MGKRKVNIEEFTMPFGKHKGKTLAFLDMKDRGYLLWFADNVKDSVVGDRVREYLTHGHNSMEDALDEQLDMFCDRKDEPDEDWNPEFQPSDDDIPF